MQIDKDDLKGRWRTVAGWAASVLGAAILFGGWLGVSGETIVAKQLPYLISGGLGGLALIGAGVGLLVAEDLRAERARIGRIEAELLEVKDLLRESLEGARANGTKPATRSKA